MLDEIKKQLSEYEIVTISMQNLEQVFEVYDTNQDFFLLTQGEKAALENIINDIEALPPACDIEQKNYISIWENGRVVGVLDLIEEYPEKTSFWIGLLLIHGGLHGQKIGSRLVGAILKAAKVVGYKSAQLGVVESNTKGLSFWQNQGFDIFRYNGNVAVMARRIV